MAEDRKQNPGAEIRPQDTPDRPMGRPEGRGSEGARATERPRWERTAEEETVRRSDRAKMLREMNRARSRR